MVISATASSILSSTISSIPLPLGTSTVLPPIVIEAVPFVVLVESLIPFTVYSMEEILLFCPWTVEVMLLAVWVISLLKV
jgi:hypothetical protein